MKTPSVKVIGFTIILFLAVAAGILFKTIANELDDEYSSYRVSSTIAEAKEDGVFIAAPALENKILKIGKFETMIEEVWIEQKTETTHQWLFFRNRIPIGHQIVITVNVGDVKAEGKITAISSGVLSNELVVNDTVKITGVQPAVRPQSWLYYANIDAPLPKQIKLSFRK